MPAHARKKLGETLVEAGLIDDLQLRSALADQRRWGNRLGKTLVKLGFVEEGPLMRHLSRLLGYPLAEIHDRALDPEVLALLPAAVAEKHRCLPLFVEQEGPARYLYLGMEEPADLDALDALQLRTGFQICPVLIGFRDLDVGLARGYGIGVEGDRSVSGESSLPADAPTVAPDCLRHGDESLGAEAPETPAPEPEPSVPLPAPPETAPPAAETFAPGDTSARAEPELPISVRVDPNESFEVGVGSIREPAAGSSPPPRPSTRQILKALTQVLIEKGVLTREELVDQVNALARRDER